MKEVNNRKATAKELMLEAMEYIQIVAGHQTGLKKTIGRWLNILAYKYYKWVE